VIVTSASAAQTGAVGATIARLVEPGDVIVLTGDLGAGKTTLTRGLAEGLGVATPVTSPTFTLVHEHEGRVRLVHVDAYRLTHLQEVHDLGFDDYLDGDAVVVIEWGDLLGPLLPLDRLDVDLHYAGAPGSEGAGAECRTIELMPHGPSWTARADRLESQLADAKARP